MDYCPSFVKNVKHFIMLSIFWLLLVLLGCTTVIQAEPNYQIPQYWSNKNLMWIKPVNVEQKYPQLQNQILTNKISYLWPSSNGLFRVGYYPNNPVIPQQDIVSNVKVITKSQEDTQNEMDEGYYNNNNNNQNNNQNRRTTEKPEGNGPYLSPCYFKICNIAG